MSNFEGTWEGHFRGLLAARGYTLRRAEYDALYGWLVTYSGGGEDGEIEGYSTVAVRRKIDALPKREGD